MLPCLAHISVSCFADYTTVTMQYKPYHEIGLFIDNKSLEQLHISIQRTCTLHLEKNTNTCIFEDKFLLHLPPKIKKNLSKVTFAHGNYRQKEL